MSKIAQAFAHGKAFIPFLTCGDPDMEATGAAVWAAAVNGAGEEAVGLFLAGKIKFLEIAELAEKSLCAVHNKKDITLEDVLFADSEARRLVRESVN